MFGLDTIVGTRFAKSGGPAYALVKNFRWSHEDQNTVARCIALDKTTPEAAGKKWVEADPDKVRAWLGR